MRLYFATDDDGAAERFRPSAPHVRILLRDAAEHRFRRDERRPHVAIEPNRPPRSEQLQPIAEGDRAGESDLIDVGEPLPPIEVRPEHAEATSGQRASFRRSARTRGRCRRRRSASAGRGVVSPCRTISSCVTAVWVVVVVVPCAGACPAAGDASASNAEGPAECTH